MSAYARMEGSTQGGIGILVLYIHDPRLRDRTRVEYLYDGSTKDNIR